MDKTRKILSLLSQPSSIRGFIIIGSILGLNFSGLTPEQIASLFGTILAFYEIIINDEKK